MLEVDESVDNVEEQYVVGSLLYRYVPSGPSVGSVTIKTFQVVSVKPPFLWVRELNGNRDIKFHVSEIVGYFDRDYMQTLERRRDEIDSLLEDSRKRLMDLEKEQEIVSSVIEINKLHSEKSTGNRPEG